MAGGLYAIATQLAVLAAARLPVWASWTRSDVLTARPTGSDGEALQSRVATHLAMDLRANVSGRTARLKVPDIDLTATYSVSINGVACSYDAAAGGAAALSDILQGWGDAINAADPGGGAPWVTVTVDESAEELQIRSTSPLGMVIGSFSDSPGTATVTCEAEPLAADVEVWVQHVGLSGWRRLAIHAVTDNHAQLAATAGLSRLALRVVNTQGATGEAAGVELVPYQMSIGPAKAEPAA